MAINIILIDDHVVLAQGISHLLSTKEEFNFLGYYSDTESAKGILLASEVDVVLLDISVPPTNGIEFCKWIKKNVPTVNVLFFSMQFDDLVIRKSMRAGGDGYVTKNVDFVILHEAIVSVAQGTIFYSPTIEGILLRKEAPQQISSKRLPILSSREKEVLFYIVQGFKSSEIAEKLFVSTKTIDFHRGNLLLKFDSKNVAELTKEAILLGMAAT